MPSKRLIARADDLGSFESANKAVVATFEGGIVRNASVLAVGHCFEDGVERVRGLMDLCVGLHATITAEWDNVRWSPVLPPERVPALVDEEGHLVKTPVIARDQGADVEQILAEVTAQLGKARGAGLDVAYLDTHMGFDWIEGVRDALADLCTREGLVFANTAPNIERCPRSDADDPHIALAEGIADAPDGTYLLVGHPAYNDDEMAPVGHSGYEPPRVAFQRERERTIFTDSRVVHAVRTNGVRLIHYTEA